MGIPADPAGLRASLGAELPEAGADPSVVVDELAVALEPGLVATAGPRYFGFVTGGHMANFSCLAAARHVPLAGQGRDVESDGLFGAPPLTVVIGEQAHSTVVQALRLLGLDARRAWRPTIRDGCGRTRWG